MEQNKSNTGIKYEEMVLWGSGSQSYFRSLSVTVIPLGVILKRTVVNFIAASSVDKRSTVRCIVLALVSISTSHCPRYISEPTVSRKKTKINQSKQIFDKECSPGHKWGNWQKPQRGWCNTLVSQQHAGYISDQRCRWNENVSNHNMTDTCTLWPQLTVLCGSRLGFIFSWEIWK